MGKLVLISGGTKSGKTSLAEQMAKDTGLEKILYIATQANAFNDEGMKLRIARHQASRPSHWQTIEAYQKLDQVIGTAAFDGVIFDCVIIWATNLFFDELKIYSGLSQSEDLDAYIEGFSQADMAYFQDYLLTEMKKIVGAMQESPARFWMVTNELGWSVTASTILGSLFVDYLGQLNSYLASQADEVYLSVMGLSQRLK